MLTSKIQEITAAKRLDNVRYAIRDLAVLADELERQGKQIVHLNVGDPLDSDFETPPELIEAVVRAMRDGRNGYAPALGVPEALEAIRAEAERKGIEDIHDVFVTQGVSEGIDFCLTALLDEGEEVLLPCPGYPLYTAVLAKLGAVGKPYRLVEEAGWQADVDELRRAVTPRTRAIVVINPNNPTGALHSQETLEAIAEVARQHNLLIITDEIYDKLVLDGASHVSMAALAPDLPIVTFGGLSKACLATGWRLGWAIVSGNRAALQPYVEGIHKLLRSRLCANHPLQYAIEPALAGLENRLDGILARLTSRRDLTVKWCESTPLVSCVAPKGAFYAFPRLEIPDADLDFVRLLLESKQVLVVHGAGFGEDPGTRHVRIVFLPPEPVLKDAYGRIGEFLTEHYAKL
jgi:alanine-synthesizing transaminase